MRPELVTACLAALMLQALSACTPSNERVRPQASASSAQEGSDPEQLSCADAPRPPKANEQFVPPSSGNAEMVSIPLTFADGSRAVLEAPRSVGLHKMAARPDMSGGARKEWIRPAIAFSGALTKLSGPVDCVSGRGAREIPIWEGKWLGQAPDKLLYLRFGDWYVQVTKRPSTDLSYWAHHLRGQVDNDGWLQLHGTGQLRIGPQRKGADSSIMFFDRKNMINAWILDCRPQANTDEPEIKRVANDSFVSFCLDEVNVEVHAQGERDFVEGVLEGLTVRDVEIAYPLKRYAIVP